jgi:FkbM family methyltransferase
MVPSPLRSLKWRLQWLSGTRVFEHAPVSSTLKFLRWTALELFDRDAEFSTPEGVHLRSMAKNFSSLSVYLTGQRDPELQAFIAGRLKPGQVFVDVGANIGVYSVFASRLVGPTGRILAIEANPGTHSYLADNVEKNGLTNVTTLNCAVGDADGELRISADRRNAGATHVATGDEDGATVPVRRLDDLLREQDIDRVHYMKIDVEGYELPVLRGAIDVLRRNPDLVVQMELIAAHAGRYGHSIRAIVEFMTDAGLSPYSPDEDGRALPIGLNEIDRHMDLLWMRSR